MTMKHKLLVLHATLLLRECAWNCNPLTKAEQLSLFDKLSDDELKDYIDNFNDNMARLAPYLDEGEEYDEYEDYIRSRRYDEDDYGPGCPWKAPGMSIADFI